MRRLLCALAAFLPAAPLSPSQATVDADMHTLRQRLLAPLLQGVDAERARALARNLTPAGQWPDIDYADQDRAAWQTSRHLSNLLLLARAFRSAAPDLRAPALAALDHWLARDYTNPNWWHNQIGTPRTLAQILLLLDAELAPAQKQKGLEILARARLGMTGQNLVWVADISASRGLLAGDSALVAAAYARLAAEIRISPEEGMQADFSFHQHGPCLYSHGYGAGFAADGARLAALVSGTRFAFPQEKIDLLARLVLDGHQWLARGIWQDYGAIGREIARPGHTAAYLKQVCRHMLSLPTGRAEEFRALLARLEGDGPHLRGNRSFWRSDAIVHQRPAFYTSARLYSERLLNTDRPHNDEGLKSHHIADGCNLLLRSGREYLDIFPLWDWQKIPGTTVVQTPQLSGELCRRGSRAFAGGVSDGLCGAAAFDFERDGLRARKAWFFFDREYVCLGAGIADTSGHPVFTTIDQRYLEGAVIAAGSLLEKGRHRLRGPTWVHHDGVAYFFPLASAIHLHAEGRTGSWWEIRRSASRDEVSGELFTLFVDHGSRPENAEYAYVVAPDMGIEEVRRGATPDVDILANEPDLQAVHHRSLDLTGIAFYEPGALELFPGWTLAVDRPCLLLLRREDAALTLAVSSPEHRSGPLTVELSQPVQGDGVDTSEGVWRLRFSLADGLQAGQSQVRRFAIAGKSAQ